GNRIREFATVHIGTAGGGGVTRVANGCLLMANSHVAHDVQLGDGCILANSVALAGHVVVEDRVIFGGLAAVHQFTRIGRLAFVSGGAMVTQDVPPYFTVQGDRAEVVGINTVGLTRAHFKEDPQAWVKLGQLGRIVEVLRGAGCSEAVLCGGIRKPRLFDVRPDWLALKALAAMRSFGDDAALRAIAGVFEAEGLRIVSPLPLVP